MAKDLSLIFERKPAQWGLRGDPYLWDEMHEVSISESLDIDEYGVAEFVSSYFEKVTGKPLTYDTKAYVERFAHGGMSSGSVSGSFWISKGIPLLIENLRRVKAGYPVITLCGSTRFKKEFMEVQKRLTLEGNIVISVGLFGHSGDHEVWDGMDEGTLSETKKMLDRMHRRKIDLADSIYVIDVGEYIGESTRYEIEYAKLQDKPVRYLHEDEAYTGNFEGRYRDLIRNMTSRMVSKRPDENIIMSPVSILILLGVLSESVSGKAKEEIIKATEINFADEDLKEDIRCMQIDLEATEKFSTANAVCVRNDIRPYIKYEYEDNIKGYLAEVFGSENTAKDVNDWVRKFTDGMITGIADESVSQMAVCLLNAITFEAEWAGKYEDSDIYEDDFRNIDGSVSRVQMMHSVEDWYVESDQYTGFIKPYKYEEYAEFFFMALLPKERGSDAIDSILRDIEFDTVYKNRRQERVRVQIPEFETDFKRDLTEYFKEIGITTLFTEEADYSPMADKWISTESVIHKAHIEVNRHGTKAAAVSMTVLEDLGRPEPIKNCVTLNRPFVYAIVDDKGYPAFVGVIRNLKE